MSSMDETFFSENVVNVNKMVERIFFVSVLVPLSFIVLSAMGFWRVPLNYSLGVLSYCVVISILLHFLNHIKKEKVQQCSMYIGILSTIVFVDLLGYKDIIDVAISYGFPPFLACLYYNRRLTNVTAASNYVALIAVMWIRSQNAFANVSYNPYYQSQIQMFISNSIGLTIESIFVFMIANSITSRSFRTLTNVIRAREERDKLFENVQKKNEELKETQYKIIQFVAQCLGSHDLFTGHHAVHTQKYVEMICNELVAKGFYTDELTEENIQLYKTSAFLHDIGKIHIPEGILNKIGKFTPAEFDLMKSHPEEGAMLLDFLPPIENGEFNKIAKQMAVCHHEKWNGTGYPKGLSKNEIPLCARIMAAADVLDALVSQRLYKDPMSVEEAMKVFETNKGTHFEECIAQAVIDLKDEISKIDKEFKSTESEENAEELNWWKQYHENIKTNISGS